MHTLALPVSAAAHGFGYTVVWWHATFCQATMRVPLLQWAILPGLQRHRTIRQSTGAITYKVIPHVEASASWCHERAVLYAGKESAPVVGRVWAQMRTQLAAGSSVPSAAAAVVANGLESDLHC